MITNLAKSSKSNHFKRGFHNDFHAKELYKSLFENSFSIMLIINPEDGCIIDANNSACRFYGYKKENLLKMKISEINTLSKFEVHEEMQAAKKEKRNHFLFKHMVSNGDVKDVEVYSSPIVMKKKSLLYSIIHDITEKLKKEREREKLLLDLENESKRVKRLHGLLPICSKCKKIRNDEGYWQKIEQYLSENSDASFSHGICPQCLKELYPEFCDKLLDEEE